MRIDAAGGRLPSLRELADQAVRWIEEGYAR